VLGSISQPTLVIHRVTTVLTTLVVIAGPGAETSDPSLVRAVWPEVAGEGAPGPPPALVSLEAAAVLVVDGPARAVRLARRLLDRADPAPWRASVHTAEVELVGDRPAGTGLAIALAVADHAEAGEVLVTRTVTDLVAGSGLAFRYREAADLDGVDGRWELYAPEPAA